MWTALVLSYGLLMSGLIMSNRAQHRRRLALDSRDQTELARAYSDSKRANAIVGWGFVLWLSFGPIFALRELL
jgi:hypothetical protein